MKLIKEKSFYRLVLKLCIPVILQNMITVAVNILDTMMLGQLGEAQISASSLANEYINLFHILCMGIGSGAAVLASQYWGRKDIESVKTTIALMLRIAVAAGFVFAMLALLAPGAVLSVFTIDQAVIDYGIVYLSYMVPAILLHSLVQPLALVMRSVHQARVPLYAAIIAFFSNLFFNWVFIFGHLGMPRMEIAGAALGTLISRVFEAVFLWWFLLRRDKAVKLKIRELFRPCAALLRPFIRFGLPVIISDLMLGVGNTVVSVIIGHISTGFVAGNAIVAPLVRLSTVAAQGFGNAGAIIVGNTLGRGERDKAYIQGITFLWLGIAVGLLSCILLLAFAPLTLRFYKITEETKVIARQLMYAVSIMVFFQCTQNILTKGVLRGGGDTRFLMVADSAFLWAISIPVGYLMGIVLHATPFLIYLSLKLDWAIKSVICAFRLKSKKWITVI